MLLLICYMSWCVPTFATWRRVQRLCTEAADCLVFCILLHGSIFLGCVFYSSLFFLKEVFGEVFFPWTCWSHVLNKSVLCWLIPVIWNVCFCVIWTSCFILLCFPFLHVAFLHVAQSRFSISARCPIPFIKMQWIVC